jgi:hypothetical protein
MESKIQKTQQGTLPTMPVEGDPVYQLAQAIEALKKPADILIMSGFLPKHIRTPEQAIVTALYGKPLGLDPMVSMQTLYCVNGIVALEAKIMVALIRQSGACKSWCVIAEEAGKSVTIETLRDGEQKPSTVTYTIEMAKTAGLPGKDNWKNYPDDMLYARAASRLARRVYPDVIYNLYAKEELDDIDISKLDKAAELPPPVSGSVQTRNGNSQAKPQDAPQSVEPVETTIEPTEGDTIDDVPIGNDEDKGFEVIQEEEDAKYSSDQIREIGISSLLSCLNPDMQWPHGMPLGLGGDLYDLPEEAQDRHIAALNEKATTPKALMAYCKLISDEARKAREAQRANMFEGGEASNA